MFLLDSLSCRRQTHSYKMHESTAKTEKLHKSCNILPERCCLKMECWRYKIINIPLRGCVVKVEMPVSAHDMYDYLALSSHWNGIMFLKVYAFMQINQWCLSLLPPKDQYANLIYVRIYWLWLCLNSLRHLTEILVASYWLFHCRFPD